MKTPNRLLQLRSLFSGLIPVFILGHFAHHLLTALPVPLLPFIRDDFSLDYVQSGLVVSAFSLAYGIGQVPAGWLADRIGRRMVLTIGICGVAVAGLLVGLSQTYIMMIVFLALMGTLGGGYHPAAPPIISASVEPKNRGRAMGLHLIGGSASFFAAPLVAAAIAVVWGWRGSFIALAIPSIIFGVVFYLLIGRSTTEKKTGQKAIARGDESAPTPVPGRLRRLVIFIVLSTFVQAVISSTISFIPLFLVDNFNVGKETSAVYISLIYSAGLWAAPLGGYISDRLGRIPVVLAVCFIVGPVIYLLTLTPFTWGAGLLSFLIGVVQYVRMAVSEAYVVSQTSERNRSTILGIYFFSSMEGGGLLTPVLGSFIDRWGFHPSFTIVGIALFAVTLVCSMWLRGRHD
ncbi:MAG: MFS transporter [Chloroflexi bacterium]|nr:MFS transporter [Chloroflexota bacterium]